MNGGILTVGRVAEIMQLPPPGDGILSGRDHRETVAWSDTHPAHWDKAEPGVASVRTTATLRRSREPKRATATHARAVTAGMPNRAARFRICFLSVVKTRDDVDYLYSLTASRGVMEFLLPRKEWTYPCP